MTGESLVSRPAALQGAEALRLAPARDMEFEWRTPVWHPRPPRPIQFIPLDQRVSVRPAPRQWLPIAALMALLIGTFALGDLGLGVVRLLFLLGCVSLGFMAWKAGPARHIEITIILLMCSPFLRRVVDLHAGYEPSGYMLVGPMLFVLVPILELRPLLRDADRLRGYGPVLVYIACIAYGATNSLFRQDYLTAVSGSIKTIAPILYGVWLAERARTTPGLPLAATRAFMIMTPLVGLYGYWQYVNPPEWDRYWMIYSRMTSIGQPEAFAIRVFSTMNSPASLATFAIAGLVLFGFCQKGWTAAMLAVPSCLGLMLSLYRTAWVALAAAIIFCMLFSATRARALLIMCCIGAGVFVAIAATPFGDVISDRLETLNKPSEDGSGQERLQEYVTLWNSPDSQMFGVGLGVPVGDVGAAGIMPVDGMIVQCWLSMGLPIGLICLISIVWAAAQALARIRARLDRQSVALGAIIVASLVQIPLASITIGELGILFWMAIGLTMVSAGPQQAGRSGVQAAGAAYSQRIPHQRINPRLLPR